LHQAISFKWAAALTSVVGGPDVDFISAEPAIEFVSEDVLRRALHG
jgi:hypothetical protein